MQLIEVIEKGINTLCLSRNWSFNLQSNTHTLRENNEEEKNLIENKWYIHQRILKAQRIIFLVHIYIGSHLSIKCTIEQVFESGYM